MPCRCMGCDIIVSLTNLKRTRSPYFKTIGSASLILSIVYGPYISLHVARETQFYFSCCFAILIQRLLRADRNRIRTSHHWRRSALKPYLGQRKGSPEVPIAIAPWFIPSCVIPFIAVPFGIVWLGIAPWFMPSCFIPFIAVPSGIVWLGMEPFSIAGMLL